MPTLDEWQNALVVPRRVIVESSAALVQEIEQRHQEEDQKRLGKGAKIPDRKGTITAVPAFAPTREIQVIPAYLLHRLGVVTTPPVENLADICSTWAAIRYLWAFALPEVGEQDPKLRLSNEARKVDFHQKALLSDEIGVAMAALLLGNYFQAPQALDVQVAMDEDNWNIGLQSKSSPDYLFFDSTQANLYIVECKGTQSSRSESLNQLRRGTEQVKSLLFLDRNTPPSLIVATCLSGTETRVLLLDPPGEEDQHRQKEKPERLSDREWMIKDTGEFVRTNRLLAQAKVLSFAGADDVASEKLEQSFARFERPRNRARRQTQIVETEFGEFTGFRQLFGFKDRTGVEIFQGVERGVFRSMLNDDPLQTEAEVQSLRERAARQTGTAIDQSVSTRRDDGELFVQSAGPDGTILQMRITTP